VRSLELAAVLLGPAFDYDFLVGVELDGVPALAMEIAEETVLPSAEGKVGHGRRDSDVDTDVAGGSFVAEAARRRSARRKKRCLIAVDALLEKGESFVHAVGVNETEHGTEDFRVGEIAGRRNVVENRWVHEVAGFIFRNFRVAAVEQNLRTLLFAEPDERFDTLFALLRDYWAHLHIFIETVPNFKLGGGVGNGIAESFLRFADCDRDRDGEAALAGTSEGASGLLALLAGGREANISLVPSASSLTLDADTLAASSGSASSSGGLLAVDPEGAQALGELPSESWLAIGLGHVGTTITQDVQGLQSLGSLMSTRALMELIVLNIGFDLGFIPQKVFTMLVIMAVVTTIMTGPLLRLLLPRAGYVIPVGVEA